MLKDKTNRNLLGILVILAILYAGSYWLKNGSSCSTALTKDLVSIDTAQITNIMIEKPGDQIELDRQNRGWLMTTEDGVVVPALNDRVYNMLSSLMHLSPSSIVTRDADKWRDYQVDSTGVRVKIFEKENKTLDLIIGRGSMQGQTTFMTYVRPFNEDNVYVIENFYGSSVSANSANYRNKTVLTTTVDSIRQVLLNYPGEDGFTLMKMNDNWQVDGAAADSVRTAEFLKGLRRITSSSFVDKQRPSSSTPPTSSLTIQSNGADDVLIELFPGADGKQILHSSQNPENFFADTAAVNKLFVPKESFMGGGRD